MGSNKEAKKLMFKPDKPHFFKVIVEEYHLQEGKLAIPGRFIREYGIDLPSTVLLKVPSGLTWRVELIKRDNAAWFGKGWHEFAEYHSLARGHMIVFQYERSCCFYLIMFDMSASEITYPYNTVKNGDGEANLGEKTDESEMEKAEEQEGVSLQILNEYPGSREGKAIVAPRPLTIKEKNEAFQRAGSAFKSENPFFMIAVQPRYIHGDYLDIPASFCRKYIPSRCLDVTLFAPSGRTWSIRLCSKMDRRNRACLRCGWLEFVESNLLKVGDVCVFELMATSEISFRVFFFRKDANDSLSVGNSKQLTHRRSPRLLIKNKSCTVGTKQVQKRKRVQSTSDKLGGYPNTRTAIAPRNLLRHVDPNRHGYQAEAKGDVKDRSGRKQSSTQVMAKTEPWLKDQNDEDTGFHSGSPFFMVVINATHLRGSRMNIPANFAREHLKMQSSDLILQGMDGRTWPVKFLNNGERAAIRRGWVNFVRNNNLKLDDVCIFELIDHSALSFRVVVIPKAKFSRHALCLTH